MSKTKTETDEIFLSVIIPAYNEMNNISKGVLGKIADYLEKQTYLYEVIFADDGSTDGSVDLLEKFCSEHPRFRVLKLEHAGKGPTVTSGMLAACGKWRLFSDFDQSTPLSEIEKLLPSTVDHQIVIGSRAAQGAKREKEPLHRHIMGVGFNILTQLIVLPGIKDSQCGFKLFSDKATRKLFPKLRIYARGSGMRDAFTGAFDVEILYLARRYRIPVAEIPVLWQHRPTQRVAPFKDSWRMLRDILRIRWASLTGKYDEKQKS